ncbi:MAG: amidohydrolase family protein, partial [Deltaproteobacteria bacterium]|nr:amidohydrolase family protein [Deltaproteobacteria bacterium]
FHLAALGRALEDEAALAAALRHLEAGVTADCGLTFPGLNLPGPGIKVDLGWHQPLDLRPAVSRQQARRALKLALQYQGDNLAFSALGPSPAPPRAYPEMFAWLMDSAARQEAWEEEISANTWSLSQWAWATRTLPARVLGLADRGCLSPGARADVAIYDVSPEDPDRLSPDALSRVHTLIKGGEIVIDHYTLVNPEVAKATYFRRTGAEGPPLVAELCQYRSFRPEHLWVPEELGGPWVGVE